MNDTCPTCGQMLRDERIGVRMPRLKARIFDAIRRAGDDGILIDDLFDLCLRERGVQRETLKTHVMQINDLLLETKFIIKRQSAAYRLQRRDVAHS